MAGCVPGHVSTIPVLWGVIVVGGVVSPVKNVCLFWSFLGLGVLGGSVCVRFGDGDGRRFVVCVLAYESVDELGRFMVGSGNLTECK